jgi:molybdate transport system ATP-binding protein
VGNATATPKSQSTVLRLRDATVRSGGTPLLDCVSLEVTRGQHWLITGPNGAGKSTLLALLLGDHPQSYVVDLEVLGLRAGPGVTLRERQQRIGFMAPELASHYPIMWSVRDVVLSGLNASIGQFVTPSSTDEQLADAWLRQLGLFDEAHRTLGSLSEAQTRKVFLARAVIGDPTLLVLDEPTQGLTQSESLELLEIIDSIVGRRDLTLIIVSHHALERPRCITHHLSLHRGRVTRSAPLGDPHG